MNTDWIKSVDGHNTSTIILENKFRLNAHVSCADMFDDKAPNKLDYRTNFSVDNENVTEEAENILKKKPSEQQNSLQLLDNSYFLIQYISKHIQQYKIQLSNLNKYIRYLEWIRDASIILSNRLKLPKVTKEFTGDLIKRTYDFCPHRSNCQINYGKKKGVCCAPHYVHNLVCSDINMTIKYIEKYKQSSSFMFDTEVFKILKQINTIQFVINQMFIELSSFKTNCNNIQNDIEKFHHNCKVEEKKQIQYRNGSFPNFRILEESDEEEVVEEENKNVSKSANLTTYRVWKE
jgi:hypothetical protein